MMERSYRLQHDVLSDDELYDTALWIEYAIEHREVRMEILRLRGIPLTLIRIRTFRQRGMISAGFSKVIVLWHAFAISSRRPMTCYDADVPLVQ